ncbi:signal peptidase I [Halomonas sp. CnH100-B]|jgi:signal peptidase I|uniref:Signal peptidase I n=1 Tax=Vreelandella aquamarina TaxID=77097 RepID=A0A857GLM9_9GAMM|nr:MULTISPECIES: signal peptidase I [Halomonas]HBA00181.1 signal peptidase I [Halomonas sp.]HBX38272.1 signal peptidase I [Pseudohongiella sp.]MCO7227953.1 signal peptidase I [Halomonas sp. CnH100-B]MDK9687014.1 signal peptidase I [Halomonas sp. LC1]MDP4556472.1 signal peptidase I [Halomonas meridiana]|tara:strand:- start:60 stop:863 length:804 start_codon:yes stop_codon:yes gene_type:complete
MDFSLLLVLAVALSGAIYLLDVLVLRPKRRERVAKAEKATMEGLDAPTREKLLKEPWPVDYSRSFFPVLLVVLVVRSFIIEPFQIPSGSMKPTLEVGDFILVNKFAYGLRLPVVHHRFLEVDDPERGDVMVFRFPEEPSVNFIKRVVGLPGDRIRYEGKQLYVNGEPIAKALIEEGPALSPQQLLLEEQLGEVSHFIYNNPRDPGPQMREVVVPEGHYFMMGDNRDHSNDSRYWGFVPEENIVGRAFAVWMHWDGGLPSFTSVRRIE